MILQKKTINNVPTLVPLTADTGSGVPVGTIIGQYKKVNMAGYLYLDGSTFDQTLYPALYAYLGTNVLPDYREFVLVGAEQNTTSAIIATHDVFTQGQEKDDQLQDHRHQVYVNGDPNAPMKVSNGSQGAGTIWSGGSQYNLIALDPYDCRHGTTTRTKEKAVFWYIKATTGIIESEATEMLNLYNEQNSYSTSEINTGKKWIDGKPIYRKVIEIGVLPNATSKSVAHGISNLGRVVQLYGTFINSPNKWATIPWVSTVAAGNNVFCEVDASDVRVTTGVDRSTDTDCYVILEYTKTTD